MWLCENVLTFCYLRDGVQVRASALQSVDLGFISQDESCQKTLKNYFIIGYKWFAGCNVSQCFVIFIASAISFSSDNL